MGTNQHSSYNLNSTINFDNNKRTEFGVLAVILHGFCMHSFTYFCLYVCSYVSVYFVPYPHSVNVLYSLHVIITCGFLRTQLLLPPCWFWYSADDRPSVRPSVGSSIDILHDCIRPPLVVGIVARHTTRPLPITPSSSAIVGVIISYFSIISRF